MTVVHLRPGHVQPVWSGHPWIFAQAVARVDGAPSAGDVVSVVDPKGHALGKGLWSPNSAIPVRLLTRDPNEDIDSAFIGRRLDEALSLRRSLLALPNEETTGYRLLHAEGDRLPGVIVDVFGDTAAVQFLTIGMKLREDDVFAHVARVTAAKTVLEVPSSQTKKYEGFEATFRVVRGQDTKGLQFRERGFAYEIDFGTSQKTGFYFDQRDNRAMVERLALGRRVLDAYSYVGAFGFAAARGGAEAVLCIDSSAAAIATGAVNARRNELDAKVRFSRADVKRELGALAEKRERFDMVVVDPPKLCPTMKNLEAGRRAYRQINANALRLLGKGGLLVSCSCSAALRSADFVRLLAAASRDANRETAVLWTGHQAPDHPVPPAFPEGLYLKSAVLRVLG